MEWNGEILSWVNFTKAPFGVISADVFVGSDSRNSPRPLTALQSNVEIYL